MANTTHGTSAAAFQFTTEFPSLRVPCSRWAAEAADLSTAAASLAKALGRGTQVADVEAELGDVMAAGVDLATAVAYWSLALARQAMEARLTAVQAATGSLEPTDALACLSAELATIDTALREVREVPR